MYSKSGKYGDVLPGREAKQASSPTQRNEITLRRIDEALAAAACSIRKENTIASPGSVPQLRISRLERSLSTSGTESDESFSKRGVPSKRVGRKDLFQLCDPETNSIDLSFGTGSSGTQKDADCMPSTR